MKRYIGISFIIAAALIAIWLFLGPALSSKPEATASPTTKTAPPSSPSQGVEFSAPPVAPANTSSNLKTDSVAPVIVSPKPTAANIQTEATSSDRQSAIYAAIDANADADTPKSLKDLVSYAIDEDKDIRAAALNGLIRRGDVSAAPLLRAAAKAADSSAVIIDLLKTAEFLELPPMKMSDFPATKKSAGPKPARSQPPK